MFGQASGMVNARGADGWDTLWACDLSGVKDNVCTMMLHVKNVNTYKRLYKPMLGILFIFSNIVEGVGHWGIIGGR